MWIDLSKFSSLSIWVMPFHCGDGWGGETLALLEASGLEARGIRWVASPRHADVLLVAGSVPSSMARDLKRLYSQIPEPKLVVWLHDVEKWDGNEDASIFPPTVLHIEGRSPDEVADKIFKTLKARREADGHGSKV